MSSAALMSLYPSWSGRSHSAGVIPVRSTRQESINLHSLTTTDISRLTAVLSNAPYPLLPAAAHSAQSNRQRTKELVEDLPARLLDQRTWTDKVATLLNKFDTEHDDVATLCKFHSRLNASLMSDILARIKAEIEIHLPGVIQLFPASQPEERACRPSLASTDESTDLSRYEEAAKCFLALQGVHAMYIPASTSQPLYARNSPKELSYQPDQCAACLLTRIGSHPDALVGLRAVMLSRSQSGAKTLKSRRLLWVESWICGFGPVAARQMLEESAMMAALVQIMRMEARTEYGAAYHATSERLCEQEEQEGESSLVPFYLQDDLHLTDAQARNDIAPTAASADMGTTCPASSPSYPHGIAPGVPYATKPTCIHILGPMTPPPPVPTHHSIQPVRPPSSIYSQSLPALIPNHPPPYAPTRPHRRIAVSQALAVLHTTTLPTTPVTPHNLPRTTLSTSASTSTSSSSSSRTQQETNPSHHSSNHPSTAPTSLSPTPSPSPSPSPSFPGTAQPTLDILAAFPRPPSSIYSSNPCEHDYDYDGLLALYGGSASASPVPKLPVPNTGSSTNGEMRRRAAQGAAVRGEGTEEREETEGTETQWARFVAERWEVWSDGGGEGDVGLDGDGDVGW